MTKKIHYDSLVDQALRNVICKVLKILATNEKTNSSQYYITFDTKHQSVVIPKILATKHPESLTIVLEHQFWDLDVSNNKFSVVLSFNNQKHKLEIGFNSIIQFTDPSADFSLQFNNPYKNNSDLNTTNKENNIQKSSFNEENKNKEKGKLISLEKYKSEKDD